MKAFLAASVCALALGAQGAAERSAASAPEASKAMSPAASQSLARLEAQQQAASKYLLSLGADKAVFEEERVLRLLNASSTVADVTTTRLGLYPLGVFGDPKGPFAHNGTWLGRPLSVLLGKGRDGKQELVGLTLSEPAVKGRDISFRVAIRVEDKKPDQEPAYVGTLVQRTLKDAFRGIGPKPLNSTKAGEEMSDVQLFINPERYIPSRVPPRPTNVTHPATPKPTAAANHTAAPVNHTGNP